MRIINVHDILKTRLCQGDNCENDQPHDSPLCSVCQTLPPPFTRNTPLGPPPRCGAPTLAGNPCSNHPRIGYDRCGQHQDAS
jgi:hypothetical protein